ncbi:MAG: NAD(P)/FAD-dependent oxidoreductase [Thermoanaerobaculia bacterium]
MSNDDEIIRIAGAGPSGLAAAITLARGGRKVEVHESKSDVGARFIGDLQVIENASDPEPVPDFLARIGIETNFYVRPGVRATFYDASGRARTVSSEEPYCYFIRRGPIETSLDRGLLAQAVALGVDVKFKSRLDPGEATIVATGPASPDGIAKEITFATDPSVEIVDVWFNHDLSPGGYSYLFALDGRATFGCAIVSDFKNIEDYFDHSLAVAKRFRPIDMSRELRTGYSYMNFCIKESAKLDGHPCVGEAGGFQDYLFGLGIRYALTTGNLAARSILEGRDFDDLWKEQWPRKAETSLANRVLYEIAGNLGLRSFVSQASNARDFHAYLASWHKPTWWKSAIASVVRPLWRNEGRCLHKPAVHWCRSKDSHVKVPPLGPVENG